MARTSKNKSKIVYPNTMHDYRMLVMLYNLWTCFKLIQPLESSEIKWTKPEWTEVTKKNSKRILSSRFVLTRCFIRRFVGDIQLGIVLTVFLFFPIAFSLSCQNIKLALVYSCSFECAGNSLHFWVFPSFFMLRWRVYNTKPINYTVRPEKKTLIYMRIGKNRYFS